MSKQEYINQFRALLDRLADDPFISEDEYEEVLDEIGSDIDSKLENL